MNQDEITQIYETLAPMAGDYANAQAEQIGQAQRSMGPMAANVMGQSQTSGLGNYTYNRLMRPQVDVMRDEIRTQGYANQLNRLLSDALNNARDRYNRRGSGGGTDKNTGTNLPPEKEYTDGNDNNDISQKIDTVSTRPADSASDEQNVGVAIVDGNKVIVTKRGGSSGRREGYYRIPGVGSYPPGSRAWEEAQKLYNVELNAYPGSSIWTQLW